MDEKDKLRDKVVADLLKYVKEYHKKQVEQKKFHIQKEDVVVKRKSYDEKKKEVVEKKFRATPIKIKMIAPQETSFVASDGEVITDFFELAEYHVSKKETYPLLFKGYAEHEVRNCSNYYYIAGDVIDFFNGEELKNSKEDNK
jgi:hypothetical protein